MAASDVGDLEPAAAPEIEDGGPAFPQPPREFGAKNYNHFPGDADHDYPALERLTAIDEPSSGMTLRDYFAGQALAGIMAAARDYSSEKQFPMRATVETRFAYLIADKMLEARAAGKPGSKAPQREEATQ